jgi:teichuronic acid biosynthesis glycosyltransferase TuaC
MFPDAHDQRPVANRVNVLTFTSLFPNNVWPQHGVFVKERITRLARLEGHEVKVVAPVPYCPPLAFGRRRLFSRVERAEVIEGLEVQHPRYFMVPKATMTSYGMTMALSALPTLRRLQRRFDFDVIDAHFVYPDGMAAVLLGRLLGKPVVVTARGSDVNTYSEMPLIRRLLRFTLRRADAVIAVSRALKAAIVRLGVAENAVRVIPNGVDATKFHPIDRAEARRGLGLPDGRIVLSVGGLVDVKGFDVLIRSFKRLGGRDNRGALLVIVGDGPRRQSLEALAAESGLRERVRFAGAVGHEDLARWYSAADLFCLASSREGWPNVVLEALACGTPVVAAAVGGIPEILRDPRVGLLSRRDPGEFAAVMERALAFRWNAGDIVEYARRHSWEGAASAVANVLRTAVDVGRQGRLGSGVQTREFMAPASRPDAGSKL